MIPFSHPEGIFQPQRYYLFEINFFYNEHLYIDNLHSNIYTNNLKNQRGRSSCYACALEKASSTPHVSPTHPKL